MPCAPNRTHLFPGSTISKLKLILSGSPEMTGSVDRHDPCSEQGFRFLLTAKRIVYIDKVLRQFIIPLIHHPIKDMQVMNAIKNERLVLFEVIDIL